MSRFFKIFISCMMVLLASGFEIISQASGLLWENISPSGVNLTGSNNFGICGFAGAMPDQPKTLYAGTCNQGIWKTTNGGITWNKTGDGRIDDCNRLGTGRNWAVAVDPTNSSIAYSNDGFGCRQGLWKTTDGGGDWIQIQGTIDNNDIQWISIDPLNHLHLLVTEHSGNYSLWESLDGGATWTGKGSPWGSHSAYVFFLGQDDNRQASSNSWLGMVEGNGLWRTVDGGAHWTQVSTVFSRSHAGAGLYRAANGTLYGCVNSTIARSIDNGKTWVDLHSVGNFQTSCDGFAGIVGDGTTIWTMPENTGMAACGPYQWRTTPEAGDGTQWTTYSTQSFGDGPIAMMFDPANRIIYASLQCVGVWKLQLGGTVDTKPGLNPHPAVNHQAASSMFDLKGRVTSTAKSRITFVKTPGGIVPCFGHRR